jgi:hypothetical protein
VPQPTGRQRPNKKGKAPNRRGQTFSNFKRITPSSHQCQSLTIPGVDGTIQQIAGAAAYMCRASPFRRVASMATNPFLIPPEN